jgi:hypothetical protein
MTRDPFSDVASRPSAETSENVEKRGTARRRRAKRATAALAAAVALATAQLVVGCAEEAERESEQTTVEPKPGIRTVRVKPPSADPPLDGQEFRLQKERDWWNHAREVLFFDIELSAEQAHAVDAIVEAQLNRRALLQQLNAKLSAARNTRDSKRVDATREKYRATQQQLQKPHEIYEEMRAVLAEEQRPAFDMGRARLVAETQEPGQIRPGKRAERAERE